MVECKLIMATKKQENNNNNEDPNIPGSEEATNSLKKKITITEFDEPSDSEEEKIDVIDLDVEKDAEDTPEEERMGTTEPDAEKGVEVNKPDESDKETDVSSGSTVGDAIDAEKNDSQDTNETTEQEDNLNDTEIGALVDDIVRTESTESLEKADAKLENEAESVQKDRIGTKVISVFHMWWRTKWLRNSTLGAMFVIAVAAVLVPVSRYSLLNAVGVRVQSSMTVIDSQTRLPLKNFQVDLQDQSASTDKQGRVFFENLKLGSSNLNITKRGYAENKRELTLGWGSNPIGEQEVVATGEQFTFILVDWLTNERIINAEAVAGESNANSDDDGKIVLTIDQSAIGEDSVTISADGYKDAVIAPEDLNSADIDVLMVPDTRHAYVSNRDSKFDIYAVDLDGENEELLLLATQKEREVPGIIQHPSKNLFALISSRDGTKNADNYTLDGLFIINSENGELENIGRSERVQIIGWSKDLLIYTQVVEGTSRGNSERSKLYSYNVENGERKELAAANYFNDIELVNNRVTYAVSSFAVPQSRARLYSVNADGSNAKELLAKQVYTIFRTSQIGLLYNAIDQEWYSQTNDEDLLEVAPVISPNTFKYTKSPDGNKVAWTITRDGKGVLFVSDSNGENESEIATIGGLDSVEYWANDETLVYRIIKSEETADYVLNINNPEDQRKISDVTASKRIFF